MKIDRRELLKRFGIGATIIPIVGAAPIGAARLIEEPVVELLEPAGIVKARKINPMDIKSATVVLNMTDGTSVTIKADELQTWATEADPFYTGEGLKVKIRIYREDRSTSPSTFFQATDIELQGVKAV